MIHIGLFEGIDGFGLAAKWMGWETLVTCEIDPFCNMILKEKLPNAYHHGDIKTLTYDTINTELSKRFGTHWRNDDIIVTGGFPCQPYSTAGKRLGKADKRHLWPQMLRIIRELSPRWVVGENVRGIISWNRGMVFDEVQSDLEAAGYEVLPFLLPACGVNAPHERYRTFFVAHANGDAAVNTRFGKDGQTTGEGKNERYQRERLWNVTLGNGTDGLTPDPAGEGLQGYFDCRKQIQAGDSEYIWLNPPGFNIPDWSNFPTQPPVRSGNDGFPTDLLRQHIREDSLGLLSEKEIDKIISKAAEKVRAESIKAAGNAVVPQLAYQIYKAIEKYNNLTTKLQNERLQRNTRKLGG